jgi:alkylhydroperoxidase/carboxymuconolactone decarboxylase family protein YurZ
MPKPAKLPGGAQTIAERHPEIWESFTELGERCAEAGPLDAHTRHLVKLAFAAGAGLEGAVHSHTRRALADGLTAEELRHVAVLAIPTLGLATAVRALTWIDDIAKTRRAPAKRKRR